MGAVVGDCSFDGVTLADEHDAVAGASDGGVEQVALEQHHPGGADHGNDHVRIFAALGPVDGERIAVDKLIEVGERVGGRFAVLECDGELVGVDVDGGDGAAASVEDPILAAVRVVANLLDAVTDPEGGATVVMLGFFLCWRV
ncbi:hypothetical protein GCM10010341_74830 [Streptomyces noursei]|nr:hypothetical protein GCM10010341_74830 [Streptomyces noursei]